MSAQDQDFTSVPQRWNEYNDARRQWVSIATDAVPTKHVNSSESGDGLSQEGLQEAKFVIATWNVEAFMPRQAERLDAIFSLLVARTPAPDIIFLQEVSQSMLSYLLRCPHIRSSWFSTERNHDSWGMQRFATVNLLSKSCFRKPDDAEQGGIFKPMLGPVWRIQYISRFQRDALFCDVFGPGGSGGGPGKCLRLVNVHLDSLACVPSFRPRQMAIIAPFLHAAERGLVAGDFNPVFPEDEELIASNNLVDAWKEKHGDEPGFTWGVDGKQRFPPARLDRIAMTGLKVQEIEVMHPGLIPENESTEDTGPGDPTREAARRSPLLPWSDHSGLWCEFTCSLQRDHQ